MIYDLRLTLLKMAVVLSSFCTLHSAFAQADGYTFLCDTNGYALPGFYILPTNFSGVLPSNNLPVNIIYAGALQVATNTVATNAAAQAQAYGSIVTNLQNTLFPPGNSFNLGNNSIGLGGSSNNLTAAYPPMDSTCMLGGKSNMLYGYSIGDGIIGGQQHRIDYSSFAFIVGGKGNYMSQAQSSFIGGGEQNKAYGAYDFVGGGQTNAIINGSYNFIAGGWGNTIGQTYGYNGVYDGPYSPVCCWAGGAGAWPIYSYSFVWADNQGTYFRNTTTNQFLIRAKNGVGINTNNCGTNALEVFGRADFSGISINGVDLLSLFSYTAVSNSLSILLNYNLLSTSNALQTQIVTVSNALAATSRAFTATVPATSNYMAIFFSTPMLDTNYSVSLLPQDQNTAQSQGLYWWVSAKATNRFTIFLATATNDFNLNFDCTVKENTQ